MHFSLLLGAVAAALPAVARYTPDPTTGTDLLAAQGLFKLASAEYSSGKPGSCTIWNAAKRQEWNTLSNAQKSSYIKAVLCLQGLPSKIGASAPGAQSRYDDFVAVHIQQTLNIHGTGNFLSWHRYFTWAYENALRTECGYTGYQPYLNWGKLASNPLAAPVFDGSQYSMSGNGAFVNHTGVNIPNNIVKDIYLPPGTGGGCVTGGPFKNMVVNLGPVSPALDYINPNPSQSGLGPNPRCLRRDISSIASNQALTDGNSTALINGNTDIISFQTVMQGNFAAGLLGVHTAGHFLVGGDPGGDIFASPGDPYFFLHHAQIDRTWWIWQNQDLANRQYAFGGPLSIFGSPTDNSTTINDIINLGPLAPNVTIGQMLSTTNEGSTNGPLCYIYL